MLIALLAAAALQAAPPPARPSLDNPADPAVARVLTAQGMSAAGVAVVRETALELDPAPLAAAERRVAQAAAAQPLDLSVLRLALEVRDSLAAQMARARSERAVAVLDKLSAKDRAVFLRVYGVGAAMRPR